ncbi:MAG: orotidine-5'-phosphate decarboxylase [Candidatus Falkowbacteria bacterium]
MKRKLIELILKKGIIKTNFQEPITFKSGIISPIYCNFRECSTHPELMEEICASFKRIFPLDVDGIIGVATGAISHATLLARSMNLSSGYIRPDAKAKDYGLKNLIEGISVAGKDIVVIEDLVSTAGSVINNAKIVEKSGAKKIYLGSIFSYDMEKSKKELKESGFTLQSLLTINDIMPYLQETLTPENYESLKDWVRDPEGWFNRHRLEFNFGFLTTLRRSALENNSIISMGLDPVLEGLPAEYANDGIIGAVRFYRTLISQMNYKGVMPGMFKPNDGFYAKHETWDDARGYKGLSHLSKVISEYNIPDLADAKRGDIGKSSQNYAEQYFVDSDCWGAITISPFMGTDSVEPFINFCNPVKGKGVYILNKTSNSGSKDFQMLKMADGRFLYQHVSDKILEWAKGRPGVGAVVGGTSLEELRTILAFYAGKNIPVLVPGVGAQGGSAKDVANVAREVGFELPLLRINSSSGLTHPWYKKPGDPIPSENECIEICINELKKLNAEVGTIE